MLLAVLAISMVITMVMMRRTLRLSKRSQTHGIQWRGIQWEKQEADGAEQAVGRSWPQTILVTVLVAVAIWLLYSTMGPPLMRMMGSLGG